MADAGRSDGNPPAARAPRWPERGMRLVHSVGTRLAVVAALFVIAPVLLYGRFQTADLERRSFMLDSIEAYGVAVAQALANDLGAADSGRFPKLGDQLKLYAEDGLRLRLFFDPAAREERAGFFYVAAAPEIGRDQLAAEQRAFRESGLLGDVLESCEVMTGGSRLARDPAVEAELILSMTPVRTAQGCWVLLASLSAEDPIALALIEPYWRRPEVVVAAVVYVVMACVVVLVLVDLRADLRRFERHAGRIAEGGGRDIPFRRVNQIPELDGIAARFDAMVGRLRDLAQEIRATAEEQSHALKTPVGTIVQSLEPLRRAVPESETRARRGLEIIEQSCRRLSDLIAAGRQATEATAQLAAPAEGRVDLAPLLEGLCEDFRGACEARGVDLDLTVDGAPAVHATEPMLETVIENVVENAIGFSAAGSRIAVSLRTERGRAVLTVRDSGPGADADVLARMFDKGFSKRPGALAAAGVPEHFGLGLWLVRRHVETLGGTVVARNAAPSGLEVEIELPIART